jgi:hypothetical protein
MDNSPLWDVAFANMDLKPGMVPPYNRFYFLFTIPNSFSCCSFFFSDEIKQQNTLRNSNVHSVIVKFIHLIH